MKHAEIFTRLAQRSDPNIPILDAAMDEIAALEAENADDLRCAQWVITHGSAKRSDRNTSR